MSLAKIQTGDSVKVSSGNYKGLVGVVSQVFKKINPNGTISTRASISTVPGITKFKKSTTYLGEKIPGSMKNVSRKIDVSNLSLITDGQISKIKVEVIDGKKVRVYKKTNLQVIKEKIEK
jgi:large subunit ribosomal protein L24